MKTIKPLRLLIIDDEISVRTTLRIGLESQQYEIEEASSGEDGIAKAKIFAPQLILLDLGLNDMDGLEVLRTIRQWSNAAILILTVRNSDTEKVSLLDAGADDYLTKPFSLTELMARMRVLERRQNAGPALHPIFEVDGLEVDLVNSEVKLDGQVVKLTATESHLLRLLVHAGGHVVTQKILLTEVWGALGLENPHYIRIYIGQLRKKIERNPAQPAFIITEPGVGYRFRVPTSS